LKKHSKKGQVSVEYIITVGFALMIIIPLTILLFEHGTKTQEEININQAGLIARKIADTADSVYYIGYPTETVLKVYMPEHIENISTTGREFVIKFEGGNEIVSLSVVNLTTTLKPRSGLMLIRISALEKLVNITEDVD